jgi:dihydrolipoamide dehydrogenase
VACVDEWLDREGRPSLGGTCLNAGCIPSKALLESSEFYERARHAGSAHGVAVGEVKLDVPAMMAHKDRIVQDLTGGIAALFKTNGVDWIQGHGQLQPERRVSISPREGEPFLLAAEHVILATGSAPVAIDAAPLQDDRIVDSTGALEWESVPQRLGIIGAGVIGLELGSVWRRLGAEVILIEAQDVFLSMADQQLARIALKLFRQQGLDIRLDAVVKSSRVTGDAMELDYQDREGTHSLSV